MEQYNARADSKEEVLYVRDVQPFTSTSISTGDRMLQEVRILDLPTEVNASETECGGEEAYRDYMNKVVELWRIADPTERNDQLTAIRYFNCASCVAKSVCQIGQAKT